MQLIKLANSELQTKNNVILQNDKVKLSSSGGVAVIADSSPAPTADDNDREGWLFHKTIEGSDKFNFYIYGNTATSHQWTMGDLKSVSMTCSVDTWSNSASDLLLWFIVFLLGLVILGRGIILKGRILSIPVIIKYFVVNI